jgi:hypothetical protein
MGWTRTEATTHIERQILIAAIMSDRCLRQIALVYRREFLTTPFTSIIMDWIIKYYDQYGEAPRSHIRDIYEFHRRNGVGLTVDIANMISDFLTSISKEFEQEGMRNEDYLIEQAERYFRERAIITAAERALELANSGNVDQAEAALINFSRPDLRQPPGTTLFTDINKIRDAFEVDDGIFELPGVLGEAMGPLEREWLIGVAAPYKRGKTWMLGYFALQAFYQKLNVAFFSLEMSERKMTLRFLEGITGYPSRLPKNGILLYPVWDCRHSQLGNCPKKKGSSLVVNGVKVTSFEKAPKDYTPCSACIGTDEYVRELWKEPRKIDQLTWRKAWKKGQALLTETGGARLKLQCWPAYTASLEDIEATLQIWEQMEGFIPDVIIIDYAGIVKPGKQGQRSKHDEVDIVWKGMKAMAQKHHAIVFSATQAGGKDVMERESLRQKDVAWNTELLGHVEMMLVINQTQQEKEQGVARLALSASRHDDFNIGNQIVILQQLAVGQTLLDSMWK